MNTLGRTLKSWVYRYKYPEYRLIADSHLFDPVFCTAKYPDIAASGIDPLLHYIQAGFAEPRQPHLYFDVDFYFSQVPALGESRANPLIHYIREGWRQGLQPNFLFNPLRYAEENSDVDFSKLDPFGHYLAFGMTEGRRPHLFFDPLYYRANNPDLDFTTLDPILHFIEFGRSQRRRPSLLFDMSWYADHTAVDAEMHRDLWQHYLDYGRSERKSPSPLFDPKYYEQNYQLENEPDLYRHYLINAVGDDDRKPCRWFDPRFYRQQYMPADNGNFWQDINPFAGKNRPGRQRKELLPFEHYLACGIRQAHYPNGDVLALAQKPLISIIVPVYNPSAAHLNNCIRSLLYQSYPHWQLCLADDCSTADHVRPSLAAWAAQDPRIQFVCLTENQGISGATNAAAALAQGEYLGFLDNDDELANDCLFRLVEEINRSDADLLYTDEDLIGEDGRRFSIFAKPDFNEELLFSHNYITHMVLCRRQLFMEVGGCRSAMDGAQDYDLFLRLAEVAKKISHVGEVLYHWRAAATSTSINHDQKSYADVSGMRALAEASERRGLTAEILPTDWKFYYRLRRLQAEQPLVAVIIHWYRPAEELVAWLTMLSRRAGYRNFQLVLFVDNPVCLEEISSYQAGTDQPISGHLIAANTSLAEMIIAGCRHAEGELLALVSCRLLELGPDWLAALVEYGTTPGIGAVGGRIEVDSGVSEITPVPTIDSTDPHYYAGFVQDCSVLLNGRHCAQQVRSVAVDLCLFARHNLTRAGDLQPEVFANLFILHDLCYRLQQLGLKNIYTPYATGQARPDYQRRVGAFDQREKETFQRQWRDLLAAGDPYYSLGILADHKIDGEKFRRWLLGS